MNKDKIIQNAIVYAKELFKNESSGHDFWHTLRVYNNAKLISGQENCDQFVVELGALLHDVDDQKIYGGELGQFDNAKKFMIENGVDSLTTEMVCNIINKMSYTGDDIEEMDTIEGKIVQDADRLDAIGAIGIGRTFAFGGNKSREMHNPDIPPRKYIAKEEYKSGTPSTINHFYEKLLKLKDLMNTETGKKIAQHRHEYMELFLKEFLEEWDGKK